MNKCCFMSIAVCCIRACYCCDKFPVQQENYDDIARQTLDNYRDVQRYEIQQKYTSDIVICNFFKFFMSINYQDSGSVIHTLCQIVTCALFYDNVEVINRLLSVKYDSVINRDVLHTVLLDILKSGKCRDILCEKALNTLDCDKLDCDTLNWDTLDCYLEYGDKYQSSKAQQEFCNACKMSKQQRERIYEVFVTQTIEQNKYLLKTHNNVLLKTLSTEINKKQFAYRILQEIGVMRLFVCLGKSYCKNRLQTFGYCRQKSIDNIKLHAFASFEKKRMSKSMSQILASCNQEGDNECKLQTLDVQKKRSKSARHFFDIDTILDKHCESMDLDKFDKVLDTISRKQNKYTKLSFYQLSNKYKHIIYLAVAKYLGTMQDSQIVKKFCNALQAR